MFEFALTQPVSPLASYFLSAAKKKVSKKKAAPGFTKCAAQGRHCKMFVAYGVRFGKPWGF
jgi:hypothetical protein